MTEVEFGFQMTHRLPDMAAMVIGDVQAAPM